MRNREIYTRNSFISLCISPITEVPTSCNLKERNHYRFRSFDGFLGRLSLTRSSSYYIGVSPYDVTVITNIFPIKITVFTKLIQRYINFSSGVLSNILYLKEKKKGRLSQCRYISVSFF